MEMDERQVPLLESDRVELPVIVAHETLPALCELELTFVNAFKDVQDLVVSAVSNQDIIKELSAVGKSKRRKGVVEFGSKLADIVDTHLLKFTKEFMLPFTSDLKAAIEEKIRELFADRPEQAASISTSVTQPCLQASV